MLLHQLLIHHPESLIDIARQTPVWVWGLLAGLIALGLSAVRDRWVHIGRLLAMSLAMGVLALWGVVSAFGSAGGTGRLVELLALWGVCYGAVLVALGLWMAPPAGARYDATRRAFRLPGSWAPLALILSVFLLKYGIGVQLAMEPTLAQQAGPAFGLTALYGLLSGLFAARALRVLQLARPVAGAALA